jgi:hypothetical protein
MRIRMPRVASRKRYQQHKLPASRTLPARLSERSVSHVSGLRPRQVLVQHPMSTKPSCVVIFARLRYAQDKSLPITLSKRLCHTELA